MVCIVCSAWNIGCLSGKYCSHLEVNFHDSNVNNLSHFFRSNKLEFECSYIGVFSPPRLKIPSFVPVVVCCQKVLFLKSFAHWQYVGRAFGSPKRVSSSKTDTCFLMEQTCKPQYQRASKYLLHTFLWYRKLIWSKQTNMDAANTYTALHMFRHVLFWAVNQGNHQNFDPSLLKFS